MDKKIEKQVVAFINKCFLVKDLTSKYTLPNPYVVAVCYELATNFRVLLDSELVKCISEEEAIEFYDTIRYLVDHNIYGNKKLLQPYFPNLIKVAQPKNYIQLNSICEARVSEDNIRTTPSIYRVVTYEEFKNYILSKNKKDKYDFIFLNSLDVWPPLEKLLYWVYANRSYYPTIKPTGDINYDTINLKLTRDDRRYILEKLNKPEYCHTDIDKSNVGFWNKLTKVLHPGEPKYKKNYPEAYRLLTGIREYYSNVEKEKPEGKKNCPKLHNIMTAAWKKGEEFEALDYWMSLDNIGLRDILEEIRHYEVSPRIDPFRRYSTYIKKGRTLKKVRERIIGNKIPTDFDQEMASEIKLSLKQKFLEKLPKIKPGNYEIPEKFRKIPATYILKGNLNFIIPIKAEDIRLIANVTRETSITYSYTLLAILGDKEGNYISTFGLKRTDLIINNKFNTTIKGIGNGKFLNEGYSKIIILLLNNIGNNDAANISVMDCKTEDILLVTENNTPSSIAFIVDLETNLLYWINERTKYFYNGSLSQLKEDSFKYMVDLFCNPKISEPEFLSLYDVCERYYGASVPGKEVLRESKVLHDIGTIF